MECGTEGVPEGEGKMKISTLAAMQKWAEQVDSGKVNDSNVLTAQMGKMNVLAISGGRVMASGSTVFFPVSSGYQVAGTLTAADDYTVRRIFIRGAKVTVKAEISGVYAEQVGDAAYEMSCYENAA